MNLLDYEAHPFPYTKAGWKHGIQGVYSALDIQTNTEHEVRCI